MAASFEGAADVYEEARPGYPAEAIQWLADILRLRSGRVVVDLAAGTGKLTRGLVGSGAFVVAVEPLAAMRRTLAHAVPMAAAVAGVAQALPFGAGRVDAVTVAQGFHWFASDAAVSEMHRVIRPGGRLGLVWNLRDGSDPLQKAIDDILRPLRAETPSYATGAWRRVLETGDRFDQVAEMHVPWGQPVDVEGVARRVASMSFVAALPERERTRLLDLVREAAAGLPPPLALSYVTDLYVYRRVD